MIIYRFTTRGEGIFSAGKRLLPHELIIEANNQRKWLPKPKLPKGNYCFYLTEKGKDRYEKTLLITHRKYLSQIQCERVEYNSLSAVVYEDEWQIVEEIK